MKQLLLLIVSLGYLLSIAQEKEYVHNTFSSTRVINSQSTETLEAKTLDFLVLHRFGNLADSNALHSYFGFDNATDILIGFNYGVTENLTLGIGRSKGNNSFLKELYFGSAKYRLLRQTVDDQMPLSLSLFGNTVVSAMKKSNNTGFLNSFPTFSHRLTFVVQAQLARKFNNWLSLQLMPTYLHRNYVLNGDENDNFALGFAARIRVSKSVAVLLDTYYFLSKSRANETNTFNYYFPLGIGIEWNTGKHVFALNYVNAPGILENDFLPYSTANWLDRQFRLGFTISRKFNFQNKFKED